ncbi:LacI family DNA-binding transcriptional regulator [Cohnella silvisoli]|uniref:LacI family DNA-binding transcriptional regulator n=1 Tax=Cohnella silvisoli TaxID=2873699 RepID=A0ABV1KSS5_9BACL|nr:LacI family DNA-binding transcriptional regulator [Cohnella silvisoli]MCD9021395.1 LacI family transcriptional regulator [Cohnella silvisoli]
MQEFNIKDVARLAGVSIATVSRVLNGTKRVNPETREKVMKVIEATDFRPNALARGLISKRTNVVGVMIPDISNEIFSRFVNGLESVLEPNGYSLFLGITNGKEETELKYLQLFEDKQIDGIILSGVSYSKNHKHFFQKTRMPIIVSGQQFRDSGIPFVNIENVAGSHMATTYLLNKGHKKIGYISAPLFDIAVGVNRLEGFKKAMKEWQLPISRQSVVVADSFKTSSGYDAAKKLMELSVKPTAIFAATDRIAIGAMNYLYDNGYSIPEDCSVIGFDDIEVSSLLRPSLTTVNVDYVESGFQSGKQLLKLLNRQPDEVVGDILLMPSLSIRNSVSERN